MFLCYLPIEIRSNNMFKNTLAFKMKKMHVIDAVMLFEFVPVWYILRVIFSLPLQRVFCSCSVCQCDEVLYTNLKAN